MKILFNSGRESDQCPLVSRRQCSLRRCRRRRCRRRCRRRRCCGHGFVIKGTPLHGCRVGFFDYKRVIICNAEVTVVELCARSLRCIDSIVHCSVVWPCPDARQRSTAFGFYCVGDTTHYSTEVLQLFYLLSKE